MIADPISHSRTGVCRAANMTNSLPPASICPCCLVAGLLPGPAGMQLASCRSCFGQPPLHFRTQQALLVQLLSNTADEVCHRLTIALRQALEGLVKRKRFDSRPENRVVHIDIVVRRPENQSPSEEILRCI